jgi:hypothetical protein
LNAGYTSTSTASVKSVASAKTVTK